MIFWLVPLALLLSVAVGAPLTTWVLRLATVRAGDDAEGEAERVLRGGLTIGILERLAITGTIMLGYPEGVAVVVAVKGLGRYPELRVARLAATGAAVSERFIIGTLTSVSWAVVVGAVAHAALG